MTHAAIAVRDATPADLDTIVDFNDRLAFESEGRRLNLAVIRPGVDAVLRDRAKGRYFVALVDGHLAGQLMLTTEWSDWRNGWFWWIQSVYVAAEFRSRGVYRTLHGHAEEAARAAGNVIGLRLYVEEENHRARATYERLRMKRTGYLLYETDWSNAIREANPAQS